jgi:uncharacterized coiled-coil protein SlyX
METTIAEVREVMAEQAITISRLQTQREQLIRKLAATEAELASLKKATEDVPPVPEE